MSDERKDLPPVTSPNFLEKVRESLSTYLGNRGNLLDRGITLRDLTDSGIVTLRPGFLSTGRGSPIGGAGSGVTGAQEVDLTPPPTPTGFTATAAISNVLVESGAQLYTMGHGHSKSILYGKEWVSGPLPIFSDAQVLTEFQGTVASYATNPATTWHLWLKWMTVDGVPSVTPAGGTNGFAVTTGLDVDALVSAMTGPGNPFTILTVDTVIDGVTYPAGTYTTLALIMDAQISNAKIKNLAVDNAKIASMSVAKLTAGSLAVGQYIQSTSYVAGTSGWRINADGTAELANATVRGSIYATAGYLQGVEVRNSAGTVLLNAGDTANDVRNSAITLSATGVLSGGGGGSVQTIPTLDNDREGNPAPNVFAVGTTRQFKHAAAIGLSDADGYWTTLETIIQYGSSQGGYPGYQYCYQHAKTWRRRAADDAGTSWTAWVQDLDREAYTGDLNATANQSDATTNNAIAAKLNNAGANVMASGFFLQTNGYAGGNGVALYDGGLIAKQGGVNKFVIGSDGSATFSGALSAATGSFAGSLSAATGDFAGSLTAATGTLGALTIASGGHVKAGQSAYHTGIGFFLGYNGATPMFSIGNPAGTHMRWDGTDLYINTATFEPFSASIPGGDLTVSITFGDQAYGSRSVSPSGGKPGYAYLWVLVTGSTGTNRPYISAGQGTSTVTVRGSGDAVTVVATVACIVTESNGRTTVASFTLSATHGSSGG